MKDCLFCKIVSGEIPCKKIYEDDYVLAFLDISQDAFGHTLVVPKKHCKNVLDCDNKTLSRVMSAAKKISKHYANKCGFDGVNICNNSGEAATQSILHLHVHIFPRKKGDNLQLYGKMTGDKTSLDKQQKLLKL